MIFLLRFILIAVTTVASVLITRIILLLVTHSAVDHSLILDLAQLILTLIYFCLICIVLFPQLLVPSNFFFKLLALVLYLLLKIGILLIELSEAVL